MFIKDGTVWKEPTPYVRDGTVWKQPNSIWVNDEGVWKSSFQGYVESTYYSDNSLFINPDYPVSFYGQGGDRTFWYNETVGYAPSVSCTISTSFDISINGKYSISSMSPAEVPVGTTCLDGGNCTFNVNIIAGSDGIHSWPAQTHPVSCPIAWSSSVNYCYGSVYVYMDLDSGGTDRFTFYVNYSQPITEPVYQEHPATAVLNDVTHIFPGQPAEGGSAPFTTISDVDPGLDNSIALTIPNGGFLTVSYVAP